MRQIRMGGTDVPVLGQGTWMMGEDPARRAAEIAAIRGGVELGMTLIDTAEMYGEGETERLLGAALEGLRDSVFLVSKAYPHHATRRDLPAACEGSLRRLKTDRIDLYLLHWRGGVPLSETVDAMQTLQRAGKIRSWGVSNLDTDDLDELSAAGGADCATDQVLYNVGRRGPEYDLLPMLERLGMAAMAYSPVEQGRLAGHATLRRIADRHGAAPLQVALAWVLRRPGLVAIPKAANLDHVRQNRAAADLQLAAEDLDEIERAFPAPRRKERLAML